MEFIGPAHDDPKNYFRKKFTHRMALWTIPYYWPAGCTKPQCF
ncbi:hypothetical protein DFAR_680011 [Desulfarculales bacterium]